MQLKTTLFRAVPVLLLLMPAREASAHPGVGIVKDSKGNIYYTDLQNIWKHSPDGKTAVVVPNVHSHELYMDGHDNLYGEHLWYEGEATDKWGHYIWRLRSDGRLEKIKEPTEGFLTDYSFVRDAVGNMYWVERGDTCRFIRRDTTGKNAVIASGKFRNVRWMHSTSAGEIYFVDLEDLYRITENGKFQMIAKNLAIGNIWTLLFGNQHSVFSIWLDHAGNIYVAVPADKCVKKIDPAGKVSIVYRSRSTFSPTSGLFDDDGNLWVLNYGVISGAKVQKIEMQTSTPLAVWLGNNIWTAAIAIGLIVIGVFIGKRIRKRRKSKLV